MSQNESFLINELSQEGKIISLFGKPLAFKKSFTQLNFVKIDMNEKDELYVAFQYLALVRKYSKDGEIIGDFKIVSDKMNKLENMNIKRSKSKAKRVGYYSVIDAIRSDDDGYLLLSNYPYTEIAKYDNQGKRRYAYWIKSREKYFKDFIIMKKENEDIVYLLQIYPESKIDVFSQRHTIHKKGGEKE